MANTLDKVKDGLKHQPNAQLQSKIELDKVAKTVKEISGREPFRVTNIIFIRQDEPTE